MVSSLDCGDVLAGAGVSNTGCTGGLASDRGAGTSADSAMARPKLSTHALPEVDMLVK